MSFISIVLPTYNGEKYISKAIESCLNQTFRNFELIIVNDCSTDSTLDIVKKYSEKDSRIRIINNEVNSKLPKSLNIGFDHAKGDFITWTSDDNYFAPKALETLASVLENNSETDIVYSSYSFIDESDKILGVYGGIPENLLFTCIVGACFLYRRKVHEELGGYAVDKYRIEDMDFWIRAATKFRYQFIDYNNLYFYRKHEHSLTSEIHKSDSILSEYRQNYLNSFKYLFNDCLGAGFTDKDLKTHVKIFFEDLHFNESLDFDLSSEVNACIDYLERLLKLDWETIYFRKENIEKIILDKRRTLLDKVINNLVFKNKVLSEKKPELAQHFDKPISWYYQEYEVLPKWYKRLGHIIKVIQGNKPLPFLRK